MWEEREGCLVLLQGHGQMGLEHTMAWTNLCTLNSAGEALSRNSGHLAGVYIYTGEQFGFLGTCALEFHTLEVRSSFFLLAAQLPPGKCLS